MKAGFFILLTLLGLSALRTREDEIASAGWAITDTAESPRPLPPFVPDTRSKDCACEVCVCNECRCKPGLVCDKDGCRPIERRPVAPRPIQPTPDPVSVVTVDCAESSPTVVRNSGVVRYRYRSAANRCGPVRRLFGRCRRSCR